MDDSFLISDLAKKLCRIRSMRLATQLDIEKATGISQETISKVINQKRRRWNSTLIVLDNYANMLLEEKNRAISPGVTDAVAEFLSFGSEADLIASIRLCASLASGRPVPRK